jgi:mRNA interferase RelE/StbE
LVKSQEKPRPLTYEIIVAPVAEEMLGDISDRRIQEKIRNRIDALAHSPEMQGKALRDELAGFRSVRAVGQRYRIIYQIERDVVTVYVVCLGLRQEGSKRDIYALARKLVRLGLLRIDR